MSKNNETLKTAKNMNLEAKVVIPRLVLPENLINKHKVSNDNLLLKEVSILE